MTPRRPNATIQRGLAAGLLAALAASCTSADDGSTGPPVTVRDSAGITIVENHRSEWPADQAWSIDSTPTVIVGDSSSGFEVRSVARAQSLADSGIAVIEFPAGDAGMSIVVYDRTGRYRGSIGRKGGGPGEFGASPMFGEAGRDTLVAWDAAAIRVTWLTLDGRPVKAVRLTRSNDSSTAHLQLQARPLGIRPDGVLLVSAADFRPSSANRPMGLLTFLVRDSGRTFTDFGRFELPSMNGGGKPSPFEAVADFVLGDDPYPMSVTSVDRWQVFQYGTEGKVRRIIRAPIPRPAVPPAMVRLHQGEFPAPDSLQAIRSMLIDRAGNLWVGRTPASPEMKAVPDVTPVVYDLIDRNGRWLGTVRIPAGLGEVMDVGSDFVVILRKDEDDVPTVRLHRIARK